MNPQDEVRKADEAKQLLNHPLFKEAFESTERQILDQMKRVRPSDERMHTRLIDAYKLLHMLKSHIKTHIETGMLAALQLEEKSKIRRFIGR